MNGLSYRITEFRRALATGGFNGGLRSIGRRINSDAVGSCRRLVARLKSKNGIVVIRINGSKMCLRINDPGLSRWLIRGLPWEIEHTQLIQEEIRPGMIGLDLGANLGYFALMEAKLVGPAGRLIAVEPSPQNVQVLTQSRELNGYDNMEVLRMAISDECGEQEMWITPESNFGNLHKENDLTVAGEVRSAHVGRKNASLIKTQTVTVDRLLEMQNFKSVDFIRMDIEGFEIKATRGMEKVLRHACHPLKVFAEVHNDHFVDPCGTIGVWVQGLLDIGFIPKALIVPGEVKGIIRNPSKRDFSEQVCQYRKSSPQIFIERA